MQGLGAGTECKTVEDCDNQQLTCIKVLAYWVRGTEPYVFPVSSPLVLPAALDEGACEDPCCPLSVLRLREVKCIFQSHTGATI